MPKLLLFAPCEKVIIDKDTNTLSLVSILHQLTFHLPPGVQVLPDAAVPIKWHTLSLWEKEANDDGVSFEQRIELRGQNNKILVQSNSSWSFTTSTHRVTNNIHGFPSAPGPLRLVLQFRRPESQWTEVASYPLEVIITAQS